MKEQSTCTHTEDVRPNTHLVRGNGDQSQEELAKGKDPQKSQPTGMQDIERQYALHKLWLSTIQRVLCMIVAVGVMIYTVITWLHTENIWLLIMIIWCFLVILAGGFVDFETAKKILAGAITGAIDATRSRSPRD